MKFCNLKYIGNGYVQAHLHAMRAGMHYFQHSDISYLCC